MERERFFTEGAHVRKDHYQYYINYIESSVLDGSMTEEEAEEYKKEIDEKYATINQQ